MKLPTDARADVPGSLWKRRKAPTSTRAYRCQCGRPVFFRNSRCLACGTPLGYEARRERVLPRCSTSAAATSRPPSGASWRSCWRWACRWRRV